METPSSKSTSIWEKNMVSQGNLSKHVGFIIHIYIHFTLVGGLEHQFYDFPYIGNFITPTDLDIVFRGVADSTTNQYST